MGSFKATETENNFTDRPRGRRKFCEIQSNLAIRNFLVALKLFLNAKSSLSLWSKWQIGHRKWFLNTNLFLIKPFLIAKFDCITFLGPMKFSNFWSLKFIACASLKNYGKKTQKISLGSKNMMLNIDLLLFTKHSFDDLPVMDEWLVETYFIKGIFAKSFYYMSHTVSYFYLSNPTIYS